jgi:hypothetical protein
MDFSLHNRETRSILLLSLVRQTGYSTVLNEKEAQRKDEGLEEDGRKRGLLTYSEYGLHGNGCLAGLR